jgi:uncharacterized protein (DUF1697 family)
MTTYLALLRGVNVGGHQKLPMASLRELLEGHGCAGVRTYIQSGNAVFRSRRTAGWIAKQLTAAVGTRHGFEPRTLVLTLAELEQAAAGNPFPEADRHPHTLHLFFLADTPARPDIASLDAIRTRTERFVLTPRVFYLLTPDGFGRSKLAARVERALGVEATARNWRTVQTLLDLARSADGAAAT